MNERVTIIGAGLAGCEACWQLVSRGIPVRLIEMRPKQKSPAHHSERFAELVCSNSLRSDSLNNAVGILKEEMRQLDSLIMQSADLHRIPAGSALAVDREGFSEWITEKLKSHPLVEFVCEEVREIPDGPLIIASGPLTSDSLSAAIKAYLHEDYFHFYDAAAPIIEKDSIDFTKAYRKSRYDKGEADYINCAMNEEEFNQFYEELIHAQTAPLHDIDKEIYFEGCMPFEEMARRGRKTLLFGPMKPVGLQRPDGSRPYAVVQLRRDNAAGSLYNLVGFQTHLKFPEQKRVFSMIPALKNAEFVRYGVMHRNTFMDSPRLLDNHYRLKAEPRIRFAGQMTGVEGYIESAASGFETGLNLARELLGLEPIEFSDLTAIGALGLYISNEANAKFQPMNINFGIIQPLGYRVKGKREKNTQIAQRALEHLDTLLDAVQEGKETLS